MVLGFGMVLGIIGSAAASSFEDMKDKWGTWPLLIDAKYVLEGTDYTYVHDLLDDVDFSSGQIISSATYQFDFTNDSFDGKITNEYVSVSFDNGASWYNLGEVDDGQYEITLGAAEIAYMNTNQSLQLMLRVDNQTDLHGSAWIDHLKLYGETTAVPIPGAVWLLGSGLIGLVGIRRRFKRS